MQFLLNLVNIGLLQEFLIIGWNFILLNWAANFLVFWIFKASIEFWKLEIIVLAYLRLIDYFLID